MELLLLQNTEADAKGNSKAHSETRAKVKTPSVWITALVNGFTSTLRNSVLD